MKTAVRLVNGLAGCGVKSALWCPRLARTISSDPFTEAGHRVRRFHAFWPVARISRVQREQLVAIGGNLMSFDLGWHLWRASDVSVIHCHVLNRVAGVGQFVARRRRRPFVVTIHGGALDLSTDAHAQLVRRLAGGIEPKILS